MSAAAKAPLRLPYALVWTPIPLVTWLLPFIGHLGVTRSDGVIYDFAGHGTVNVDQMAFGAPAKYYQLHAEKSESLRDQLNQIIRNGSTKTQLATVWDDWLNFSKGIYSNRLYSFLGDNCHAFVAHFLNSIRYDQNKGWNAPQLAFRMFVGGSFIGVGGFLKTWAPFALVMGLGYAWLGALFVWGWLGLAVLAGGYFLIHAACLIKNTSRILSI